MLSDILRRIFYPSNGDDVGGDSNSFGPTGLPQTIENDLRQRYISSEHGWADEIPQVHQFNFGHENSMDRIFSEFEQLFRSLLDGSGLDVEQQPWQQHFETDPKAHDAPIGQELRDKMLTNPSPDRFTHRPFHGDHQMPDPLNCVPDKDLDDCVNRGQVNIDTLLKMDKSGPTLRPDDPSQRPDVMRNLPNTFSSFNFSSTTTTRKADGTIESRRTVRDSEGNEEVYITRTIGDKTHTIKKKLDSTGAEETEENFINMDEDDANKFNNNWSLLQNEGNCSLHYNGSLPPSHLDNLLTSQDNGTSGLYDSIKQFFKL